MNCFYPEGLHPFPVSYTIEELKKAQKEQTILQSVALLCDEAHNLHVDLGCCKGVIEREETSIGIRSGQTRDIAILTRVGRPVCFHVKAFKPDGSVLLSRRCAQEQALDWLIQNRQPGDILPAIVTHTTEFGAFCDIGCGIISLLGIENISVSRIRHANQRFSDMQHIYVVIKSIDPIHRRLTLSHKELLGTWEENIQTVAQGQTLPGIVRSIKEYGAFIELTPNLSGLAESNEDLSEGDAVSVYIKSIIPEKLKVKLIIIRKLSPDQLPQKALSYTKTSGHINTWQYGNNQYAKHLTIF